jgi:hypothetical protein
MDYGEEPTKTALLIGVSNSTSMRSTNSSPWQTESSTPSNSSAWSTCYPSTLCSYHFFTG